MEFQNLVSSKKAVSELNKKLGLQKVKPKTRKSNEQVVSGHLNKACKFSKKVLKNLKSVIDDPSLISDYVATVGRFTTISEKIISKLGGDSSVKKDIETY
jgi:hypothetical protein